MILTKMRLLGGMLLHGPSNMRLRHSSMHSPSLREIPSRLICSARKPFTMAAFATAEAVDNNAELIASGDLRCLQPMFQIYGQRRCFSGPILTLKVFEDNVLVRSLLESKGEGRVLVIDGGGSMRCALVGGNLGQLAQNNGWGGIVVNGCVRDVDEINGCDIGVRALGSNPLKSSKKGHGEKHVPVHIGGTLIKDGEWLYADSDGILISKTELSV
ncbi:PREDICTED: putative 4-hydroxy-4-methyl-2-oxoglutarate aldolase 3 isoform X2 [Tarenaya hassleriana]|nr:PREDICTED: putative 4-hydroxy-4-methyl-2-oxoglutarate aldolase 3 isoform X2 [Tarenaya hassleriana]